jgi:hypothetical protein
VTEPDTFEFVGRPLQLHAMESRYEILEMEVLAKTFPWWKRGIAWFLWRTPIKHVLRRRFMSPYGAIRATLRPRSPISDSDEGVDVGSAGA